MSRRSVERLPAAREQQLQSLPLTYDEVGATAGVLPGGYDHVNRSAPIGRGREDFERAADAVLRWQVQARSGLRVLASGPVVSPGSVVELRIGPGPVAVRIPCRVVYLVDEPDRRGFGYGTLPGHPETGEESFVVRLRADGNVVLDVTAFSKPAWRAAKLAPPLAKAAQMVVIARYLRSLRPRT